MSTYEIIALNTGVPRLQAPTTTDIGALRGPMSNPGVYTYQYLTGASQSVFSTVASFAVNDLVIVSAYNSSSPKAEATWKCTATGASLPASATAGNVTGTANGALYVANPAGNYYKFEISSTPNVLNFGALNDGTEIKPPQYRLPLMVQDMCMSLRAPI